jgi:hypothetical protein
MVGSSTGKTAKKNLRLAEVRLAQGRGNLLLVLLPTIIPVVMVVPIMVIIAVPVLPTAIISSAVTVVFNFTPGCS